MRRRPETTSIIITLSGSIRTSRPERYEPPVIHVQAVEVMLRWAASRPSSDTNVATAPPKATKHASVAR